MIFKTNDKEKQGQQEKPAQGIINEDGYRKMYFSVISDTVKWLAEKVSYPIRRSKFPVSNRKLAGAKATYLESHDIDTADCQDCNVNRLHIHNDVNICW